MESVGYLEKKGQRIERGGEYSVLKRSFELREEAATEKRNEAEGYGMGEELEEENQ